MLLTSGVASVSAFFMALLIHEAAHLLAASALGVEISSVELTPFGCVAEAEGLYFMNGAKEVVVAAAGPAANILVSALLMLAKDGGDMSAYMSFFLAANISLAAMNLLPVLPMDGGRVLCALLGTAMKEVSAMGVVSVTGIAFSTAALAFGVYMALHGKANPTLFIVGGFMLIVSIGYLRDARTDAVRHALNKPREFPRQGIVGVRALAAHKNKTIGKALLGMDAKKYNIVYIVDDDLRVLRKVDEGELIEGALSHGTGAGLENLL